MIPTKLLSQVVYEHQEPFATNSYIQLKTLLIFNSDFIAYSVALHHKYLKERNREDAVGRRWSRLRNVCFGDDK